MNPQTGKLALGWGIFLILLSGGMLPFQQAGTAEYLITLATFFMALLFTIGVAIFVRLSR
jgi:hypothetical protein